MNQNDMQKDREVRIGDLFLYIFKHWKSLLAALLVGAVLFGAVKCERDSESTKNAAVNASDLTDGFTAEKLEELDRSAARIAAQDKVITDDLDYLQNSMLMQMNAMNHPVIALSYLVETKTASSGTDAGDALQVVLEQYQRYLQEDALYENAAAELNTKAVYLRELISYDQEAESGSANITVSAEKTQAAGTLSLKIAAPDSETCEKIADAVKNAMEEADPSEISGSVRYTITALGENETTGSDQNIADRKSEILSEIRSAQNAVNDLKEDLSDSETAYLNAKLRDTEKTTPGTGAADGTGKAQRVTLSKKYILFGILVGLFLAAIYWCVRYFRGEYIATAYDFTGRPGIRLLPVRRDEKKRGLSGRFESRRYRDLHIYSTEQAGVASTAYLSLPEVDGFRPSSVIVTGTDLSGDMKKLSEEIAHECGKAGLQVIGGGVIPADLTLIRAMGDADAAVVVERVGSAKRKAVSEELAMLKDAGVSVTAVVEV